jgi:hypothetical protein
MPLSKPAKREHIHTRQIQCKAYLRDDKLWDVEGHITDVKTYSFPNHDRDGISAGEHIHDMSIRLTLDGDFLIHAAEVIIDAGPTHICAGITHAYQSLVGVRIQQGWRKEVLSRFGRVKGCTHVTELLLGSIATTAYQALGGSSLKASEKQTAINATRLINTCHALSSDGPVAQRQWPELYTGTPEEAGEI